MGRDGEKKRVGGDTDRDKGLRPRCEPGAMSLHIWGSSWMDSKAGSAPLMFPWLSHMLLP